MLEKITKKIKLLCGSDFNPEPQNFDQHRVALKLKFLKDFIRKIHFFKVSSILSLNFLSESPQIFRIIIF
jgi:hypothetical protein